jgi:predicted nucleic acid-binding protein
VKVAFVDTLYFVALFNPRDQWHERAIAASKLVAETKLITTEDVLVELLNFFSEYGEKARRGAVSQAEEFSAARISKWRHRATKHLWPVSPFTKHDPTRVIA